VGVGDVLACVAVIVLVWNERMTRFPVRCAGGRKSSYMVRLRQVTGTVSRLRHGWS
jgi:hypothetical protein